MPRNTIESIHVERLARELEAAPACQHRRQGHLALEAREREAEADMQAEAEGEVRHAVARQVDAIRLVVGARIAVGGVHQQEDAIAGVELPAVQRVRLLHDAHLRADRAVVAQQLFDRGGRERAIRAQLHQLVRKAQQRSAARWRDGAWWSRARRTAAGCRSRPARRRTGGRRHRPAPTSSLSRSRCGDARRAVISSRNSAGHLARGGPGALRISLARRARCR